MDTRQILCALHDVNSFLDVFSSDLLPLSRPVLKTCTLIFNADPHTEGGSQLLAIRLTPSSSSAYYFDAYGGRCLALLTNLHTFPPYVRPAGVSPYILHYKGPVLIFILPLFTSSLLPS